MDEVIDRVEKEVFPLKRGIEMAIEAFHNERLLSQEGSIDSYACKYSSGNTWCVIGAMMPSDVLDLLASNKVAYITNSSMISEVLRVLYKNTPHTYRTIMEDLQNLHDNICTQVYIASVDVDGSHEGLGRETCTTRFVSDMLCGAFPDGVESTNEELLTVLTYVKENLI